MINILQCNLGQEYAVLKKQDGDSIQVYKKINDELSQEVYLELEMDDVKNEYRLFLVQKGKKFEKSTFENKPDSICGLGIYAESVLGVYTRDHTTQNEILNLEKNQLDLLNQILKLNVGEKYYSISIEKKGLINLEKLNNGSFNIYYLTIDENKIILVENREAPSAFLVLYNFSLKLKRFDDLCAKWKNDVNLNLITEEKIKRLYLGK
ncbi:hypothetical protein [Fictibacillus phosphorivorans]|uniref:hypothetical protein n=1 Tax=Fictibacillus phosphorivorans TaxID=1221500 RepID=UPI001293BA2D|nr:hypothetical protein [Fictibacillus phosphorivorans]MQR96025.1 hypothetical protein [Fictibacillus phosphorivorans]